MTRLSIANPVEVSCASGKAAVVFIDAQVGDMEHLLGGVQPGVAVQVLTSAADGMEQITTYLQRHPTNTVHLVTHGAPGRLWLGKGELNLDNLETYAETLATWFQDDKAELLIYGCSVAAGDAGAEFIKKLHRYTGVAIGASTTPIGNADLGGNWNLEVSLGRISTGLVFSPTTCADYPGILSDGTLDPTFGTGGKIITPIGMSADYGYSMAIDSIGRIVVAGSIYNFNGYTHDIALARYNPDGTLDTSFGINGAVITPVGLGNDFGSSVAIDSDGNIIVAGSTYTGSNSGAALVRYTSSGAMDSSFGTNGIVLSPFSPGNNSFTSVEIDSSGGIIATGSVFNWSSYSHDFALARYNSDGTLDTSFGTNGTVLSPISSGADNGSSAVIDSSGRIIVAGYTRESSSYDVALARYNPDGTIDTSFGTNGTVITSIVSGDDYGYSVALDSSGNIIVAGYAYNGTNQDIALARYTSSGALDLSFGVNGSVVTPLGLGDDYGYSVAIDGSDKIIVAGYAYNYNSNNNDFALVRYNPDGTLDPSFGINGVTLSPIGSSDDYGYSVVIDGSGNIIVSGSANNDFALARFIGATPNNAPTDLQIGWQQTARPAHWLSTSRSNGQQAANNAAFAALKSDGSVVTWGYGGDGGDSSGVSGQLSSGVETLFSTRSAFAALKSDGRVVTWGNGGYGGDSSAVSSELSSGVETIFSNLAAFAAVKSDGRVVTWGDSDLGGNSSGVSSELSNGVEAIFATGYAFAALKSDGSVVTWGSEGYGSNSSGVAGQISSGVETLFSTFYAFAALKSDGRVVTWGDSGAGGYSDHVSSQLSSNVVTIASTMEAFAALKSDGSVVTWGASWSGGDSNSVSVQLSRDVTTIVSTSYAFAALKSDGRVVTWGSGGYGGYSGNVSSQLSSGVEAIYANSNAFAALKSDGSVVTWGDSWSGGDSSSVSSQLSSGVEAIFSTAYAFAALKSDGSVVTWGGYGGDSSSVSSQLSGGVETIFSTAYAFAALKSDGSVVTWGDSGSGGDSSGVGSQLSGGVVTLASLPKSGFTSTTHMDENIAPDTVLGQFFTTDIDATDTFTYALVSGVGDTDNAAFRIEGNQLIVQISPDHETQDNYSIRVRTTDQDGASYDKIIGLGVNDLQEAPTSANTSATLDEGTAYAFSAGNFPYADDDNNVLTALRITSLPGAGQLFFDANDNGNQDTGEAIALNQVIPIADLSKLTFRPDLNTYGNAYATFGYQVGDAYDFSQNSYTFTLNVISTNVPPTGSVTISGTEAQGQILTASNDLADINGMGAITYTWYANGVSTGVTTTGYTLTQADVDKVFTVVATYTDGVGKVESVTSAATAPVANLNDGPVGSVTISGTATQGQTLTAANTLADADGLGALTYTWYADGTSTGTTGATYALTQADVGKVFTVKATYIDNFGQAESVTSAATSAVANINDPLTGTVTISGTATQGQVLTASNDLTDVDGIPGSITYTWFVDGISTGITGTTYTLTQADVGKVITVEASYTDGFGKAESITSAATAPVANLNDDPTGTVTITGTTTQGQVLTASNTLTDVDGIPGSITYAWFADGSSTGVTGATYTLGQADVGKVMTVQASYTDGGSTNETVTSSGTSAVANINDNPTGTVTISGAALQGQTLTASNNLTDSDGIPSITYTWFADGSSTGVTGATYTLGQLDVGKVFTVKATYIDNFGQAESVTSVATSAVANINDPLTGTVTISGTATQGQVLTASNDLTDVDGIPGSITYTWFADGISTGITGTTYTLTQAEVGKALTVQASYTDGFGKAESITSAATAPVADLNDDPTGTVTITGTTTQGQVLMASNTLADVDGLGAITYTWFADGVSTGTTGASYILGQADVGKVFTVVATYTDNLNQAESVTSAPTSAVANFNDPPTGTITITGTATQGQVLTVSNTLADVDGLGATTYIWFADGMSTGTTGATYALAQTDVGKVFTVVASYIDDYGQAESVTSAATSAVLNVNDLPTGVVTLSGEAKQGYVLTANPSTLADVDGLGTFSYQWQQSINGGTWNAISGATSAAYTLTPAQVGQSVRVQVSYTDGQNTLEEVFSQPTAAITAFKSASDFTGDGQADILWRNATSGSTVIWGMSATTPQTGINISPNVDGSWQVGAVADFDGNGSSDILWQHTLSGQPVIWLFDGPTATSGVALPQSGAAWQVVGAGDFSRDGQADILWRNAITGENAVWLMSGPQPVAGVSLPTVPTGAWAVKAVGDFSRDGQVDILWRNSLSGETVVWLMEGETPVRATTLPTVPVDWELQGAADFTGDTHLDLLWHHQTTGEVVIWAMQGLSPNSAIALASVDPSWEAVI